MCVNLSKHDEDAEHRGMYTSSKHCLVVVEVKVDYFIIKGIGYYRQICIALYAIKDFLQDC